MNKELEACFKEIYHEIEYVYDSKVNSKANKNWSNDIKHYDNIRGNVLTIQRYLESIDNAKPSEALEKLLDGYSKGIAGRSYYDAIKPVLLKAQEQEKVLEIIKKKVTNLVCIDDDCVWDNELYCSNKLTKEESELLKRYLK